MDRSTRAVRHYDEEFQRRAVELVETNGKSVRQTALELGMPQKTLARWKHMKKIKDRPPLLRSASASNNSDQLLAENQQLRRQLAEVEQQRDILKKALAIFSTGPDFNRRSS